MIDSFKKFVMEAMVVILYTAAVAAITIVVYVVHYSHASGSAGQRCWHQINSTRTMGIEKVCTNR